MANVWKEFEEQEAQPSAPMQGGISAPLTAPQPEQIDPMEQPTTSQEIVEAPVKYDPREIEKKYGITKGEEISSPQPTGAGYQKGPHGTTTRFHQAPIKQPGEKDLTVGETLRGAASNLIPSALGVVGAFTHALTHPADTLGAIGDIGTGLLSKAAGAAGAQQDPTKKKQDERVTNALWDHYKKTYFTSMEDFKRAFAKDPASILLDFSTLTGVGSAALPGKLGKIAKVASTVTDPIQSGLAVARGVGSIPARALRLGQSTASNVPYSALTDIYEMARRGTPEQKAGFQLGRQLPETDITHRVVDALDSAADAASAEYLTGKGQALANKKPPIKDVLQTIQKAEDDLTIAGKKPHAPYIDPVTGNKVEHPYWDAYQQLQNTRQQVLMYDANPAYNLLEADKYKRSLYEQRNNLSGKAQNSIDQVAKAVRKSISDVSPEYATIMDKWQNWIMTAKGIRQAGASTGLSPAASMTKLLNSMKSDLKRKNVIDVLAQHDKQIPYILAGYATKPMHKGNIGLMDAILSGAGYYAFAHPLGAVGTLGLASPRLSSVSQTALGKIGKYGAAATSRPVTAGAYYGERALEEEGQQPGYEYNVNSDDTFGRMLSTESGNQQFTKTGETMTSPKGALGAAQIMPETAPEASALAGEKFDPERLKSDKEYNVKLGRAYFGKMLEDFGDERLAVAAYNAGPGRIRSALSQAEKSGGIWEDFIPDETKGYLRKVFGAATGGRIERASGGSVKMNHIAEADKLIAAADRAKKMHNKSTEPLLNLPDEHVTHALAIANESI